MADFYGAYVGAYLGAPAAYRWLAEPPIPPGAWTGVSALSPTLLRLAASKPLGFVPGTGWAVAPEGAGGPTAVATVNRQEGTAVVYISLTEPLTYGAEYVLTIPDEARDIGGRPMQGGPRLAFNAPLLETPPLPPRGTLEALLEAFAAQAGQLAGVAQTVLTAPCDPQDTTVHVVSTLGFRPSGYALLGTEEVQYTRVGDYAVAIVRTGLSAWPVGTSFIALPGSTATLYSSAVVSLSPATAPRKDLAEYLLGPELGLRLPYPWLDLQAVNNLAVATLAYPQGTWTALRAVCRAVFGYFRIEGGGAEITSAAYVNIPTANLPAWLDNPWHVACLAGCEMELSAPARADATTRVLITGAGKIAEGLRLAVAPVLAGYTDYPAPFVTGEQGLLWRIELWRLDLGLGAGVRGTAIAYQRGTITPSTGLIEGVIGRPGYDHGPLPPAVISGPAIRLPRRGRLSVLVTPPFVTGVWLLRPWMDAPNANDDLGGCLAPRAGAMDSPVWAAMTPLDMPSEYLPAGTQCKGVLA
jgi:hypothetical protein